MTFDQWFDSKQGTPYNSMYVFAKEAWYASIQIEREECAVICENQSDWNGGQDYYISGCYDSAKAIRSKS